MAKETAWIVEEQVSLLPFLLAKFPAKGRNKVKGLLTHRQVTVEGQVVTRHDFALRPGQRVQVHEVGAVAKDSMHGVRILFEDVHLLVIDKPTGLLSMATDEEREATAYHVLTEYVQRTHPQTRVFIVHRLDRETSGVMLFAKSENVQQALQNAWKDAVLERSYLAVVEGRMSPEQDTITTWLKESKTRTMYISKRGDGLKAVTHYKVLHSANDFSLLEVRLETGRKNQIRVHMQSRGHSVVGDKRYGSTKNPLGRLGLHARILSFRHPVTNEVLRFETGIPTVFNRLFADQ